MYGIRICLVAALSVMATLTEAAEDYIVPEGVSVLTEDQLLNSYRRSAFKPDNRQHFSCWKIPLVRIFFTPNGRPDEGKVQGANDR